eukprot:TRINITY_DN11095_c0_g1_i1.p1 TRINITY_DN11095_c0_g1~~TRINITY_DN11095_c0_g1_i1.p1  ORF type:complete len:172 (+),score=37.32 TRINITY_DN11095_c0_g1_i1:31-546(+)
MSSQNDTDSASEEVVPKEEAPKVPIDPVADWRCPDCAFINRERYCNVTCHRCGKPKPEDEELIRRFNEVMRAREKAKAAKRFRGGEREVEVREDMERELENVRAFVEKWEQYALESDDTLKKLEEREAQLNVLSQIEDKLRIKHAKVEYDDDFLKNLSDAAELSACLPVTC